MDERLRIQSDLYPWILLSVMNGKRNGVSAEAPHGNLFPDVDIAITSRHSSRVVRWSPDADRVAIEKRMEGADLFSGIGFDFFSMSSAVKFFESSQLNPLAMKKVYRMKPWVKFLRQLLWIQGELGCKNWENLNEAHLLRKTILTIYSAVVGLNGLRELDLFSADLMNHLPDGCIRMRIEGVDEVVATIGFEGGRMIWLDSGATVGAQSVDFTFKSIRSAWMSVSNLSDNLAAVGKGDIRLRGFIPLADGFNHMLDRLQMFVKTE